MRKRLSAYLKIAVLFFLVSTQFASRSEGFYSPDGSDGVSPVFEEVGLTVNISPVVAYWDENQVVEEFGEDDLLQLEFRFEQDVSDILNNNFYIMRLYDLIYRVSDEDGNIFFTDKVDLSGYDGPGTLTVKPGIGLPPHTDKIFISARLAYKKLVRPISSTMWTEVDDESDEASIDVNIHPSTTRGFNVQLDSVYGRFRRGYLRRHLLDVGRGYSFIWLKEYEPGIDHDELLYFSRTLREGADEPTKLYIPWIRSCGGSISNCGTGNSIDCGASVSENSSVLYGSDENPLLRGGLAMATFALENNVNEAIRLLKYFEKSEWIDNEGKRTGFFLRSRNPGDPGKHEESTCEYFYASADEIVGMTLGLYYLHDTLKGYSPDIILAEGRVSDITNRIEQLVTRLGNFMKANYYFLIPPQGLPQKLHTGWYGGFYLQWYLNAGFHAITGHWFTPGILRSGSDFWNHVTSLNAAVCTDSDCPDVNLSLSEQLSIILQTILSLSTGFQRAELFIQGLGIALIKESEDSLITRSWFGHFNFPMLLHAFQLGMANERVDREELQEKVRKIKEKMSILIRGVLGKHAVDKVNFGDIVLNIGPFGKWNYGEIEDLISLFGDLFGVKVGVGTCDYDPHGDYYAAAVALAYELPEYYEEFDCPDIVEIPEFGPASVCDDICREYSEPKFEYYRLLYDSITLIRKRFTNDLPVGKRAICDGGDNYEKICFYQDYCTGGTCWVFVEHNKYYKIGKAFVWEAGPDGSSRLQDGGGNQGDLMADGLWNSELRKLYDKGIDAVKEGAGLGYLFPTILLHRRAQIGLDLLDDNMNLHPEYRVRDEELDYVPEFRGADTLGLAWGPEYTLGERFPYLRACANVPGLLAELDNGKPSTMAVNEPCSYRVPERVRDVYESGEFGNDSYSNAKKLTWGVHPDLTIDKSPLWYVWNSNRIYAKYSADHWSEENYQYPAFIERGWEYDYYYVDNYDHQYDVRIEAEFEDAVRGGLYVDGFGYAPHQTGRWYGRETNFTQEVRGRPRHVIMVTGDIALDYSLTVTPLPTPVSKEVETDEDTPVEIILEARDPEGDQLTYTIVRQPIHGSLSGTPPFLTYTPHENYYGRDSFTFTVHDGVTDPSPFNGVISILIYPVLDPLVAYDQTLTTVKNIPINITLTASSPDSRIDLVFDVSSDPAHGTVTGTPPNITYTPNPNFVGSDSFQFKVGDSLSIVEGNIRIDVVDRPVAHDQFLTTLENTPIDIVLTVDPPGDISPIFKLDVLPQNGSIEWTPLEPDVTYTPNTNFIGEDFFTFVADTTMGTSNTGIITIRVIRDLDSDGFTSDVDCDDTDPDVFPGNPDAGTLCDGKDTDCDGISDFQGDEDQDQDHYPKCGGDCNDDNANVNPGTVEICDFIDNDCNGQVDEGFDFDGDNFTVCQEDCDDSDGSINPAAPEKCNDLDDNCNGLTDEGFPIGQRCDSDDTDFCQNGTYTCNPDGRGVWCVNEVPMNIQEECNNIDDDCDVAIDEDFDQDTDDYTTCEGDCNDNNASIYPTATEVPDDSIDQDCNGSDLSVTRTISIPDMRSVSGVTVEIPVNVDEAVSIGIFNIFMSYDETILDCTHALPGDLTSGWIISSTKRSGGILVDGENSSALPNGGGSLTKVQCLVIGEPGNSTILQIGATLFNLGLGDIPNNPISGELQVTTRPMGDINADGELNILDVIIIENHIIGRKLITDMTCADLVEDGVITVLDVIKAQNMIIGRTPLEICASQDL
ncbi:MAG: Ig-like domain-containing protein [Planctomycetota bacterium]